MTKYMIHTYPKRLWYVEQYLIPSMIKQGIPKENIVVYNDSAGDGNLKACMKAFASVDPYDDGVWHLQDDVCICRDFRILTEKLDFGIVCGFSSNMYDGVGKIGAVKREDMWYSFPCIRIPNEYALDCADWVTKYIIGNPVYRKYWEKGQNDDWAFRAWLKTFHKDVLAINLAPNLVDHVDYLLGGTSQINNRKKWCRAQYWTDTDLIKELEESILHG